MPGYRPPAPASFAPQKKPARRIQTCRDRLRSTLGRTVFGSGGVMRGVESLEPRRLMAAVLPTAAEQYLLELVNRARADPAAEAARLGVDLNEGLPPGTITGTAKQPLAFNPQLGDAARSHTRWMLDNDTFTHDEGPVAPPEQMRAAGYVFKGAWRWGQNIWWNGRWAPEVPSLYPTVAAIHTGLFVDADVAGRGHRLDILNDKFKEIGVAAAPGMHVTGGHTYNVVGVTEDFAVRGGRRGAFLTGVAYADADGDHFYTPGEGLGGVTITATRARGHRSFATTTWVAGGYNLHLPKGTYRVTASGGALSAGTAPVWIKVRSRNVKV